MAKSPRLVRPRLPWRRMAVVISALCALAASLFLLLASVYGGVSYTAELGPGDRWVERVSQSRATFVAVNGPWVYLILAVPVVLAGMPLLARRR